MKNETTMTATAIHPAIIAGKAVAWWGADFALLPSLTAQMEVAQAAQELGMEEMFEASVNLMIEALGATCAAEVFALDDYLKGLLAGDF